MCCSQDYFWCGHRGLRADPGWAGGARFQELFLTQVDKYAFECLVRLRDCSFLGPTCTWRTVGLNCLQHFSLAFFSALGPRTDFLQASSETFRDAGSPKRRAGDRLDSVPQSPCWTHAAQATVLFWGLKHRPLVS
jgi:hypothetical protein